MAIIIAGDDSDNFFDLTLLDQSATVSLLGGNDTVIGTAFNDILRGGDGDDTFIVEGSNQGIDTISGGLGFDTVLGGSGDDVFRFSSFTGTNTVERVDGGGGFNLIQGSAGNNTLNFAATELLNIARIEGLEGNDVITGSAGNDVIVGGAGDDRLTGGAGDDTFIVEGADQGIDTISGGLGFDTVVGGSANDVFRFSSFTGTNTVERVDGGGGFNLIQGSAGNNTLNFAATELLNIARIEGLGGNDVITGSAGNDVIVGGAGDDRLTGGAGDDTFIVEGADQGIDTISGGLGFDTVVGGSANDVFRFSSFNTVERVDGGGGFNLIQGSAGNNTLNFAATELLNIARIEGLGGNDVITGSAGNDVIVGGAGDDRLMGGAGDDTFIVTGAGQGLDTVSGGAGFDRIIGGAGDDIFGFLNFSGANTVEAINGGAGANIIRGSGGNNTLDFSATTLANIGRIEGLAGNDTIKGSDGDDIIVGGLGNDMIDGRSGDDVAVFSGKLGAYRIDRFSTNITVTDLDPSDGDEGVDKLVNIERLLFADGELRLYAPNQTPSALPDFLNGTEDQAITISSSELLANDFDPDGDLLSISGLSAAKGGSATLDSSGNVRFTPAENFNGEASFVYAVSDGRGGSSSATVSISIAPVNDAPQPQNDNILTAVDTPVVISAAQLLSNDVDPDGDSLSITGFANVRNGTVFFENGDFTFTPTLGTTQSGSFDYFVTDGNGVSESATVAVEIDTGLPGFKVLATAIGGHSVFQWDGGTGEFLGSFIGPSALRNPHSITVGPDGNVYIAWGGNSTQEPSVHRYAPDGTHLGEYASMAGLSAYTTDWLTDLVFDNEGYLYVLDKGTQYGQAEVFRFDRLGTENEGAYVDTYLTPASIERPERRLLSFDMEIGPDGNLYFASVASHDILRYKTPSGEDFGRFGEIVIGSGTIDPNNPLNYANLIPNNNGWSFDDYFGVRPWGLDFDESGHFFVAADMLEADFTTLRVIELDAGGNYLRDLVPLSEGYIAGPGTTNFGEADFGPDGNFYITARHTSEVLIYGDPSGGQPGELLGKLQTPTFFSGLESIAFLTDAPLLA